MTRFFRKNITAKKKLQLKKLGVYNLLPYMDIADCVEAIESSVCEDFTALNTFGLDEGAVGGRPTTHFIDRAWLIPLEEKDRPKHPKSLRVDQLHKRHALDLSKSAGLERLYLINARYKPEGGSGRAHSSPNSSEVSPGGPCMTVNGNHLSRATPNTTLRDLYLDSICGVCGPTLKHLILPARWLLSTAITARLIRSCPNLTQLSAAIECRDLDVLRILVPFLSNLWAIRVLAPFPDVDADFRDRDGSSNKQLPPRNAAEDLAACQQPERVDREIENTLGSAVTDLPKLRYVGVGDRVWEAGPGVVEEVIRTPIQVPMQNGTWESSNVERQLGDTAVAPVTEWREEVVRRRRIKRITKEDVKDVEIWKMDSLDVI